MNLKLITPNSASRIGAAPGHMIVPEGSPEPTIDITVYSPETFKHEKLSSPDELSSYLKSKHCITWVDVNGLGSVEILTRIGEILGLHRLVLEDLVFLSQRPKVEDYDQGLFMVSQFPLFSREHDFEQISLFTRGNLVVTFQAYHENRLVPVLKRIQDNRGRIRKAPASYLVYAILDLVVDAFFPVLEELDSSVEELEDAINDGHSMAPRSDVLHRIYRHKKEVVKIRRNMWAMREMLSILPRDHGDVFDEEERVYLRDSQDHAVRILEIAEMQRELCNGLVELHQNMMNQRMNEVMKTLTITATIFIPITFIAGIYGMNFDTEISAWNLPELGLKYGYPMALSVMLLTVLGMVFYFFRKGWIGKGGDDA